MAGCLAAAQEQGIEFVGYGGTSAGSMVALLASAGYTGREVGELLKNLDFRDLLDDKGTALSQAHPCITRLFKALEDSWWGGKLWELWGVSSLVNSLGDKIGLYHGQELKQYLLKQIRDRRATLAQYADITFEHLEQAGCPPLKVVASDITTRRPAVFSRTQTDYGASVLDAVRASTSYPFVFQPVEKNDRWLVDGGLSSNLPAFLFAEEYRSTGIPAFAFDLTVAPSPASGKYGFSRFLPDMLATAFEASDEVQRRVLRGVHYVPVPVPPDIGTLDFGISAQDRARLYDIGHREVSSFLAKFHPLQRAKEAGNRMKQLLQAEYGSPQLFQPVLYGLAKQIEKETGAYNVRVTVMLPTGRPAPSRIVVYGYNMDGDPDSDLELPEDAGCTGQAWATRGPAIADLEEAAAKPEPWKMTEEQHAKVPKSRKAMLAVPIHAGLKEGEKLPPPPIGTLAVDTTSPLERTGWLDTSGENPWRIRRPWI